MNVIVTGATGFIGKYFTKRLLAGGYDVYAVVRDPMCMADLLSNLNLHIIEKSLETLSLSDFSDIGYDCFFHLAWGGVNRSDIDDPKIHHNNYSNSVKCLQIAYDLKCKGFIDCGSKAEYGLQGGIQYENLVCIPYSAYGTEKLNFYQFAARYAPEHDILYAHPRFFSVIGINDHPWSLISTACRKMSYNENMELGPCRQLWNFLSVRDAVDALFELYGHITEIDGNDNRIFNIASYDTRVLRSFVEEIYMIAESKSRLIYQDGNKNVKMDYMNPSIDKLVELTSWKPRIIFAKEIENIIAYVRMEKKER